MSIQSTVGNFTRTVRNDIDSLLTTGKNALGSIVGSVTTSLSNVWSGGFAGMSEQGLNDLAGESGYINTYCNEIQEIIKKFNAEANIDESFKGTEIQTAITDFLESIKDMLEAYVSTMRTEAREAAEAYNNFHIASRSIASDATQNSTDIKNEASNIRVEATSITLD